MEAKPLMLNGCLKIDKIGPGNKGMCLSYNLLCILQNTIYYYKYDQYIPNSHRPSAEIDKPKLEVEANMRNTGVVNRKFVGAES